MNKFTKRLFFRIVAATAGLAALAFFFRTLSSVWLDIQSRHLAPEEGWLLPIIFMTASPLVASLLWGRLTTAELGLTVPVRESLYSHLGAWLMRYLPALGSVGFKAHWLSSKGTRLGNSARPIITEGVLVQSSSLLLGSSLLLPLFLFSSSSHLESFILFITGLAGISLPFVFAYGWKFLPESLRSEKVAKSLPFFETLELIALYSTQRSLSALAAFLYLLPLTGFSSVAALAGAGCFLLAAAAGFLAPFVPGGIGVREGVLVAALLFIGFDAVTAVTASVVLRILSTISDLLIAAVWFPLNIWARKKSRRSLT